MRVLRPSLAQHRADFERGNFARCSTTSRSLDDGDVPSKRRLESGQVAPHVELISTDNTVVAGGQPQGEVDADIDSRRIQCEITRLESDIARTEEESKQLACLLGKLRSSDDAAKSSAASELLRMETHRNERLAVELDHVRSMDRLVLEACTELKLEIQHLRRLRDIDKIRALYRFEHPCGEIFLYTKSNARLLVIT